MFRNNSNYIAKDREYRLIYFIDNSAVNKRLQKPKACTHFNTNLDESSGFWATGATSRKMDLMSRRIVPRRVYFGWYTCWESFSAPIKCSDWVQTCVINTKGQIFWSSNDFTILCHMRLINNIISERKGRWGLWPCNTIKRTWSASQCAHNPSWSLCDSNTFQHYLGQIVCTLWRRDGHVW